MVASVAGVSVLGALVFAYLTLEPERILANGCPAAGPERVTVVIVDATDELSAVQRVALANELVGIIAEIPVGGGIQMWRVAASALEVPSPAAEIVCNPGKVVSQWTGNPSRVEKRYREVFEIPLAHLARTLTEERASSQSPIMETIQAAALKVFGAPQYSTVKVKTLIVASDLIQN
jgi:hypothetical protein